MIRNAPPYYRWLDVEVLVIHAGLANVEEVVQVVMMESRAVMSDGATEKGRTGRRRLYNRHQARYSVRTCP